MLLFHLKSVVADSSNKENLKHLRTIIKIVEDEMAEPISEKEN